MDCIFLGFREKNMFKPQVTIKNTGTIALKDYHAKLWFRVLEGKELYPNESVVEGNIVLHLTKCLRLESQVFLVNFIK